MIINQLVIFIVAFLLLAWASKILVGSLTKVARFMQVSEYVLAFIIMGVATSIPELFLAVSSGISGVTALSFGNIIGANILNMTMLVGLIAFIGGGIRTSEELKNNTAAIFIILILPFVLVLDGSLRWFDGLALIAVYLWYLSRLIYKKHSFKKTGLALVGDKKHTDEKAEISHRIDRGLPLYGPYRISILKQVFSMLGAVLILLGASFLVIDVSQSIADSFRVGLVALGVFIVAVGTTVPELAFGIRSVILKHDEMTVGNAMGSLAVNSSLVLGLAALLSPIEINFDKGLLISIGFLITVFWIFKFLLRGERMAITRKEGAVLVVLYMLFVLASVVID